MNNQDEKNKKDNLKSKSNLKNEGNSFQAFKQNNSKPFEQFSNPKNYHGGPNTSPGSFHRRLNNRRSSGK